MLWAPQNRHQPQMPGSRIGDRATEHSCHSRASSLLRQEQRKGLNYVSAPGSVCWEASEGCRGVYLDHIPGAEMSPTAFPMATGPAHAAHAGGWRRSQPGSWASPHLLSHGNVPQVWGTLSLREGSSSELSLSRRPCLALFRDTQGWRLPPSALSPVNV